MSGQHSKEKSPVLLWLAKVRIAKLAKFQERYGKNRTQIIDLLIDRATEDQLDSIVGNKQPEPIQAQPLKSAVVSKPSILSQRQIRSAPKNQAK